jgi:hypothetical protein
MGKKVKNFKWEQRVCADDDSVDRYLHEGIVVPEVAKPEDLLLAAEWLATYGSDSEEDAQKWANVIAFLMSSAKTKQNRSALAQAKKKYAEEKGIKVSQVRIHPTLVI